MATPPPDPTLASLNHDTPEPLNEEPATQTQSRLLSLPTELRLSICRYMSLSPIPSDLHAWSGAYSSCQQLRCDMRASLDPSSSFNAHLTNLPPYWTAHGHSPGKLTWAPACPHLHRIHDVTISIPIPTHLRGSCCHGLLGWLYALHLEHLRVRLTGSETTQLLYGDLKSWGSQYFIEYVRRDHVRCKRVTFTLEVLAQRENGRVKTTTLPNTMAGIGTKYEMDIVQDEMDRQTERSYWSENRFRAAEKWAHMKGCRYD